MQLLVLLIMLIVLLRLQMTGLSVGSVVVSDRRWHIIAAAVVSVFARWTTTVHGL